jgi:hypothetical protein
VLRTRRDSIVILRHMVATAADWAKLEEAQGGRGHESVAAGQPERFEGIVQ